MSVFEVSNVSLRFGGVQAINNVSFNVEQGEVFAIIGPNGAGKTSMLNVITRVFDATSGKVQFEDQEITAIPRHKVVHSGISRTFQNIELFEGGTVLDNLLLGRHRFTAVLPRSGSGLRPCAKPKRARARRWKMSSNCWT